MRVAGVLLGLAMVVAGAMVADRLLGAGVLAFAGVLVMVGAAIAQPPPKGGQ